MEFHATSVVDSELWKEAPFRDLTTMGWRVTELVNIHSFSPYVKCRCFHSQMCVHGTFRKFYLLNFEFRFNRSFLMTSGISDSDKSFHK